VTPGTTIGRYVVKRKLAEGGMAEILLCAVRGPEGFEKEVVLKRIRSHFATDTAFVRMFVAEARVVSRLHHPNIVQVFDFDQDEDSYYLAMEYVRGKSLWDLRKRCREQLVPLPPVLAAFMAAEVARALDHAHGLQENGKRLGLVHRDVTPHNVLLSYDGAVKLADFGIVKSNLGLTAPGTLKGKLAYMSPEQARGEPVDARTDVFALGIVLWELLTGGRLFEGGNEMAILRAVQESSIAPPARLNPDVPPALSAVVERALQRGREARYQTAAELERALREVLIAQARSVEDTDVGAFLRQMFPEEATPAPPPVSSRESETAPGRGLAPRGRAPAPAAELEPPSAAEAPTLVVRPPDVAPAGPPEPSLPSQLGMKQALAVSGAAIVAGALLTSVVGLWIGRRQAPAAKGETTTVRRDAGTVRNVEVPVRAVAPVEGPALPAEPVTDAGMDPGRVAGVMGAKAETIPAAPAPAPPRSPSPLTPRPPTPRESALARAPETAPAPRPNGSDTAKTAGVDAVAGTLQLRVIPWAQAWVDGKPVGEVGPQREFPLPPGAHQLRVEHPRGTRQLTVQIQAGEVTPLSLDMLAP